MPKLHTQVFSLVISAAKRYPARKRGVVRASISVMVSLGFSVSAWVIPAAVLAQSAPLQTARAEMTPPEVASEQAGFAGNFLSSRFAKSQKDLLKASELADETLKISPKDESLLMEAIRVHVLAGNIEKAQNLVEKLPPLAQRDPMPALLLMLKDVDAAKFDEAKKRLSGSGHTGLLAVIKPAMDAWITLAAQHDKPPVPSLKQAIDQSGFFAPFLQYQQSLMYDVVGMRSLALKHMQASVSEPESSPYRVVEMLVRMHLEAGDEKKARALAEKFNRSNPDAVFSVALPEKGAPKLSKEINDARSGLAELFFTTASILFEEDFSPETLAYLRLALHLRPNFPPAQFMLAHAYEQQREFQRAITVYDSIQSGNAFYERGQLRKALNLEALGKTKEASALLDRWLQQHPGDISAYITKGDMLREQKRYEDAAVIYSQVIDKLKAPKRHHWPVFYTRGICYERTQQWAKAEADFEKALALEPNQPDVLNYLAYSWLTMGKNLQKAREYLKIAVSARPDDAHIVDSMGWAHYIAGDFEKASEYLERAVDLRPDDAAINDHLGDAYWRLGRVIEARYQWKRALGNKPDDELAGQLKQKISSGLPPFLRQRGTNQLTQPSTSDVPAFKESGTLPLTP